MCNKSINVMLGAVLLTTLFSGCSTEGPGGLGEYYVEHGERDSNVVVLDSHLSEQFLSKGKISFEHPVSRNLLEGKLLQVQAEIRNRQSEKSLELEVSTVFRDGGNVIVDESSWEKIKLSPNQIFAYKINSICKADKYCVRLRAPRRNTNALNGQGINLMADKMLRSLVKCPQILNTSKIPRIALHQFDNRTNQKMDESIFISKLRAATNSRIPGKIIFVSRRDDVIDVIEEERRKKREGLLTQDKNKAKEKLSGVDYFITGKLHALPGKNYLLFTYQLIDAENTDILWGEKFEIGDY
jgi:TolB-like protein